jgi:hypothetical protein
VLGNIWPETWLVHQHAANSSINSEKNALARILYVSNLY